MPPDSPGSMAQRVPAFDDFFGSSSMLHFGQRPGVGRTTSGCIGHVYLGAAGVGCSVPVDSTFFIWCSCSSCRVLYERKVRAVALRHIARTEEPAGERFVTRDRAHGHVIHAVTLGAALTSRHGSRYVDEMAALGEVFLRTRWSSSAPRSVWRLPRKGVFELRLARGLGE